MLRLSRVRHTFSSRDANWLASSFCAIHRVAFDPALFTQRYPAPIEAGAFAQAAGELGLNFEERDCSLNSALA